MVWLLLTLLMCPHALQQTTAPEPSEAFPVVEWTIEGQKRQAIVIPPSRPPKEGASVVAAVHPGGHKYPPEAPELIVRFFKELGGGASPQATPEPSRAPN
ncbi:MAG: hypothetical protein N2554_04200 [Fimbriimonadales bacterium]|nr:hypothetical protein [Fimbriimonadales bacterium]